MKYKTSKVAGARILSLSSHPTTFWTGEKVEGSLELSKLFTLSDESKIIGQKGQFSLIAFKKVLVEDAKLVLLEIISQKEIDFVLVPSLFSTLVASGQLSGLPKGKLVAFNATLETQRFKPAEKLASDKFTLIW